MKIRLHSKLQASEYKKTLKKSYAMYKRALNKKLKSLKTSNTKEYWNIINSSVKSSNENVSKLKMEVFVDHFKKLNNHDYDDVQPENVDFKDKNRWNNDILDKEITENELNTVVKKLKAGKSPGCDGVLNEFIKKSFPKLGKALVVLFNLVLLTGLYRKNGPSV